MKCSSFSVKWHAVCGESAVKLRSDSPWSPSGVRFQNLSPIFYEFPRSTGEGLITSGQSTVNRSALKRRFGEVFINFLMRRTVP